MLFYWQLNAAGENMKYEGSQPDQTPLLDRVISTLNFVLVIVIVFCFNYMVIDFLF